jgi:hypothetical protein
MHYRYNLQHQKIQQIYTVLLREETGPLVSNAMCISHHVLYSKTTQERPAMRHITAAVVSLSQG